MSAMFYVYIDMKPDGEPFYVGKGNAKRVGERERNRWHAAICNKHPDWSRDRVFEGTEAECFAEEKRLIALYGRRDLGLGTLVNMTDGGEGLSNVSVETRAKMSASKKNMSAETRAKMSSSRVGKSPSIETRAKLSAAQKGRLHSAEARAKISAGNKGRLVCAETRAKISAAKKGKSRSAEHRAKLSAATTAYHAARRAAAQAIANASATEAAHG